MELQSIHKKEASQQPGAAKTLVAAIAVLRPKQWTKNLLLFAGLIFSENLLNYPLLAKSLLAFAVFCLLSGSAYIINDICDIKADRSHPRKRRRPLASGDLGLAQALAIFVVLLCGSLGLAFYLGLPFFATAAAYFILVSAYSFSLKHFVILDVFAVAAGFLLRAVAGAVVIEVYISPWLLICTLLLALFLALNKRRSEILAWEGGGPDGRRVLAHYSVGYLDQLISIVTASTIMAYSLYTFSKTEYLMLSIPFVIYGIFRYLYLAHKKEMGESPEDILLKDKPLAFSILLWLITCVAVLYLLQKGWL